MIKILFVCHGKTKKASGRGSYRSGRLINLSKPTNPPVNKNFGLAVLQ